MFAGLVHSKADIYVTIDADLQDDTSVIKEMVDKYLTDGAQIVYGVRNDRSSDTFFKRTCANLYYKLNSLFGMKTIPNHADYRLMSNKVVEVLRGCKERNLYLRGIIPSLGFKTDCVYYARKKRCAGSAKYNFLKSSALALEGITSYSTIPLRFISLLGFLCFIFAILMSGYSIFAYFTGKSVPGWTSQVISVYFLGGVQLLCLGIIGEYVGKIYNETKQRPHFLVEETTGA